VKIVIKDDRGVLNSAMAEVLPVKKFEYRAKQTKRILKPNLHRSTVVVDGVKKKMMLCTKCLRKVKGKGKGK